MTLCASLLEESEKPGSLDDIAECVTHYLKLNETLKKFQSVRGDELPSSADDARTFRIPKEVDQQCLSALEKLFEKLPQDHDLKKTTLPLHLGRNEARADGGGDSAQSEQL